MYFLAFKFCEAVEVRATAPSSLSPFVVAVMFVEQTKQWANHPMVLFYM